LLGKNEEIRDRIKTKALGKRIKRPKR